MQAKRDAFYSIKAKAEERHAEILIYDEIGPANFWVDTVDAKSLVKDLQELDVDTIDIRLNSPGGDVFDGVAIYNALRDHPAKVRVKVDGFAASIASVIMLAGDERVIGQGAQVMIHDPWGFSMGGAADMRKYADLLDGIRESIVDIYTDRTGMDRETLTAAMANETWYGADAALEAGFATGVSGGTEDAAIKAVAKFDERVAARFQHVPERIAAALRLSPDEVAPALELTFSDPSATSSADSSPAAIVASDIDPEHEKRVRELLTR